MRLHRLHEQATSHPLSYDELVQLQRGAAQAWISADLLNPSDGTSKSTDAARENRSACLDIAIVLGVFTETNPLCGLSLRFPDLRACGGSRDWRIVARMHLIRGQIPSTIFLIVELYKVRTQRIRMTFA